MNTKKDTPTEPTVQDDTLSADLSRGINSLAALAEICRRMLEAQQVNGTAEAAASAPARDRPFWTHDLHPEALHGFSMDDLQALSSAARMLGDVASAVLCEPRFYDEASGSYKRAGQFIDRLSNMLGMIETMAFDEVVQREPVAADDIETRAWMMVEDEARMRWSFNKVSKFASLGMTDVNRARENERREPVK